MAKKKTYKIPVEWTVVATLEIQAEDMDEALEIAKDHMLPEGEQEYMDGSYRVLADFAEEP